MRPRHGGDPSGRRRAASGGGPRAWASRGPRTRRRGGPRASEGSASEGGASEGGALADGAGRRARTGRERGPAGPRRERARPPAGGPPRGHRPRRCARQSALRVRQGGTRKRTRRRLHRPASPDPYPRTRGAGQRSRRAARGAGRGGSGCPRARATARGPGAAGALACPVGLCPAPPPGSSRVSDPSLAREVEARADEGSLESRKDVPPPAVHVLIGPAGAGPPWTLVDGPRESWAVVWCIQLTPAWADQGAGRSPGPGRRTAWRARSPYSAPWLRHRPPG